MYSYTYTREMVSGFYNVDNPLHTDDAGISIPLAKDIEVAFSGSGFNVGLCDWEVNVYFDSELTDGEKSLLDDVFVTHRDRAQTQIENINCNWRKLFVDYKKARSVLKDLVWTIGFDNLSLIEKKIASRWFVVPQDMRNTVHSISQQVANGKVFHDNSVEARKQRADAGTSAMYNYLSTVDAFSVVDDVVNVYGLMEKYINYGREGVEEDTLDGLFDYLHSRSGSMYEGSGLLNKNITPIGITLPQLADAAMNIFKNGAY